MEIKRETGRRLRQKERKHYTENCLEDEEIEGRRMFSVEEKLASGKFKAEFVKEMTSTEFSLKYIQENGFNQPIIFQEKIGLGIRAPTENFTVYDVRQCVGSRRVIDVMDTETQTDIQMTMKDWCKYYENKEDRQQLLNVISLEFSHTRLENYVESPKFVRQIDWSDVVWPRHLKESQTESTNRIEDMKYPKVQKYCLMSVKGCFTDFHVDFGGTSVWYHILHGKKVFWLIPPTEKNLELYEQWVLSGKQGDVFFGDQVDRCARIKLEPGYTFLIPSGWIHAVYTPEDSLVFGGNFLHSFGVMNQLKISDIEDATHVQQKFRYPFFTDMHWFVLQRYVYCLTGKWHLKCNEDGDSLSKINKKKLLKVEKEDLSEDSNSSLLIPPTSPKEVKPANLRLKPNAAESDDKENLKIEKHRSYVHLTKYEINGLKIIIKWLQSHHQKGKKSVPHLINDADSLISDVKLLIEEHENDDPQAAVTGKPVLFWQESLKRKFKPKISSGMKSHTPNKASSGGSNSVRRRRTRCKRCDGCLSTDCGECQFCKDMRKFGGPGRMKQSCKSRQCMAPILPHTASCSICGKDGIEKLGDTDSETTSLMECSLCWDIVHVDCISCKHPNIEPNVNEDLPNSWECPKCIQKTQQTGSAGPFKPRSLKKYKTTSDVHHVPRHDSSDDNSNNSNDNYFRRNLDGNQNSNNFKQIGESSCTSKRKYHDYGDIKKKIKMDMKGSGRAHSMLLNDSLKSEEYSEHTSNKDGSYKLGEGDSMNTSSHVRSCSRNANIRSLSVSLKNCASSSSSIASKIKSAQLRTSSNNSRTSRLALLNSRERLVRRMKGLKKSSSESILRSSSNGVHNHGRINRLSNSSISNGHTSPRHSSSSSPAVSSSSNSPRLTVKVEKLRDSPRLMSPPTHSNHNITFVAKRSGAKVKNENVSDNELGDGDDAGTIGDENDSDSTSSDIKRESGGKSQQQSGGVVVQHGLRDRSTIKKPRFVVRPAPVVTEPEKKVNRGRHVKKYAMDRKVMVNVFRYLTPNDLFYCQLVCKNWNALSIDPVLWRHMEVSRRKLNNTHLVGIVRRQPYSLDISWTNISRKQLSWLMCRLPQMRKLNLAGCSWAAVSAMCTADCPLLTCLNLNWVEGLTDSTIRDLLSKPPSSTMRPGFIENKTRLRSLAEIKLAGADISDMSVRLLVQHLSLLSCFDISQCRKITDMGIAVLATTKYLKLIELDVSGCINVSDTSLDSLKRCVNLNKLDMRECPQVTLLSCQRFLFHNKSKFTMKEDRLFERV